MERKKITIDFVDFFKGFDKYNNDFITVLKKKYVVQFSKNPDYIIYSCFGDKHLQFDCIRIFYTGECVTPNFNDCDYAIGFDRLDFGDRYVRIPLYKMFDYKNEFFQLINREDVSLNDIPQKTKFCNFIYSNSFAQEKREAFFKLLNQYKPIDSGGRFLNNIGYLVKHKIEFQSNYKFSIAFENTVYRGYSTEKIVQAFVARTIPIYYGDPEISLDFNDEAFINCHDFENFEKVIERIKNIDLDDELFLKIINSQPIIAETASGLEEFLYHICDQELEFAKRRPSSVSAIRRSGIILRHRLFEEFIYKNYLKIKTQIKRLMMGKSYLLKNRK